MDPRILAVLAFLLYALVLSLVLQIAVNVHERHYLAANGAFYRAPHTFLPGYVTSYVPEHTVQLSDWVGTECDGLSGETNETENPEVKAARCLKKLKLFEDHKLVQSGEHWVLYRAPRTERRFTWKAPYRIWWGTRVDSIGG